MSDVKHTPGPWSQSHREGPDGYYRTQVYPANDPDNAIATLHWHSVQTDTGFTTDREANARLIAAAPDLLKALEEIVRQFGDTPGGHMAAVISATAIAKAKGEA